MTYGDGVGTWTWTSSWPFTAPQGARDPHGVRPPPVFGALDFDGDGLSLQEQSSRQRGLDQRRILRHRAGRAGLHRARVMGSNDPMERLAAEGRDYAIPHPGFWQCMDNDP